MTSTKIILGGQEFTLTRPLLGQLKRLASICEEPVPSGTAALIDRAVAVIGIGLAKDYPGIAFDESHEVEMAELIPAMKAILAHNGFVPGAPSGEGPAPAAGA